MCVWGGRRGVTEGRGRAQGRRRRAARASGRRRGMLRLSGTPTPSWQPHPRARGPRRASIPPSNCMWPGTLPATLRGLGVVGWLACGSEHPLEQPAPPLPPGPASPRQAPPFPRQAPPSPTRPRSSPPGPAFPPPGPAPSSQGPTSSWQPPRGPARSWGREEKEQEG